MDKPAEKPVVHNLLHAV